MKKENVFWLITSAIFIGLLLPTLVQQGMFLDGITYSGISKNMSHGLGSFWNPQYTKTLYLNFHEHPALFFIIQSSFFRLLGDGIYTERIFTFLTALISAWGIILCWNIFTKSNEMKKNNWFIIFLWITLPVVIWSYKNNMLENLLSIFTIFAVFFISKSLIGGKWIYLITGSIFIFFAFLTKGPVGLFPLIVPLAYLIFFKEYSYKRNIIYFALLTFLTISIYLLITNLFPEIGQNITFYLKKQLFPAIGNQREKYVNSHFAIIEKLLTELALPLIIIFGIGVFSLLKRKKLKFTYRKESFFFLFIALSASLPMMITLKQRRYYLVPSLAFYIISAGFFIVPYIIPHIEKLSANRLKWFKRITVVIFATVILFATFQFGKYSRDEVLLKDIDAITAAIPKGTIISTTKETWSDWLLHAYLNRMGNISLDCDHELEYFLIEKEDSSKEKLLSHYELMDIKLNNYQILKAFDDHR